MQAESLSTLSRFYQTSTLRVVFFVADSSTPALHVCVVVMVSTLVGHDCISVTIPTTPCLLSLRDDTSAKMCCAALVPQCVVSVESKSASCREAERGADTQNDVEAALRSLALFRSPLPLVLLRGVALTQACSCTCPGTM